MYQYRQLSLCLSEVVRSQIFIGILGERYGHTPKTYSVPHLPEYEWVSTNTRSMETHLFFCIVKIWFMKTGVPPIVLFKIKECW